MTPRAPLPTPPSRPGRRLELRMGGSWAGVAVVAWVLLGVGFAVVAGPAGRATGEGTRERRSTLGGGVASTLPVLPLLGGAGSPEAASESSPMGEPAAELPTPGIAAALDFAVPAGGATAISWGRASRAIRAAAAEGADYVVLPELALSGPPGAEGPAAEPVPGPTTHYFGRLARSLDLWIGLTVAEAPAAGEAAPEAGPGGADRHYVTAVLLGPDGRLAFRHRRVAVPASGATPADPRAAAAVLRGDPRELLEPAVAGPGRLAVVPGADLAVAVPQAAQRGAGTVLVSAAVAADAVADTRTACADLSRRYRLTLALADRNGGATGIWRDGLQVASPLVLAASGIAAATDERPSSHTREGKDAWAKAPGSAAKARPDATSEGADGPSPGPSARLATAPVGPARGLRLPVPLGLPPVPVPPHLPLLPAVVELGRDLFSEPALSRTGEVSCASCHRPDRAFADGRDRGRGVDGRETRRNVPSLWNVAYRSALFWDGRATTLESQAKYPLSDASEMDFHYLDRAVGALRSHPTYPQRIRQAFGLAAEEEVEFEHLARALAAYQRTLVSADSPFDRFLYGGDEGALAPAALRGLALFAGRAGCAGCHTVERDWALFQDGRFHNTGVGWDPASGTFADPGVGLVAERAGFFLTPSLRNVSATAPYMHDGSLPTLESVVRFYDRGGNANPNRDPRLAPLALSDREVADLVAFLESLTSADERPASARIAAVSLSPLVAEASSRSRRPSLLSGPAPALRGSPDVQAGAAGRLGRLALRLEVLSRREARVVALPAASVTPDEAAALARRSALWLAVAEAGGDLGLWAPDGSRSLHQAVLHPAGSSREDALESRAFRDLRSVETPAGRLGVLAGGDVALGLPRLAELGVDAVLVSTDWPVGDPLRRAERARAEARRLGLPLLVADLAGGREELAAVPAPPDRELPLGLPPLPRRPGSDPELPGESAELVELGRHLFFDPGLSADGEVSCATCHDPSLRFTDGRRLSAGVAGRRGVHNVPTVVNSAYRPALFWRGDVRTLEDQVLRAVEGYAELDTRRQVAVAYVASHPVYRPAFASLTGRAEPEFADLARALAAYERSLLSAASPFDRWYYGGHVDAVPAAARRGFDLFRGKAGCAHCHALADEGALFSDGRHHNTGVGFHPRFLYLGYGGDGIEGNVATANEFRGEYLTPSLRDVAETAPYMHDGSLATLTDVVDFYDRGGIVNPHLDPRIRPLGLSAGEKRDLVAFLETLSGEPPPARLTQPPNPLAAMAAVAELER